MAGLGRERVDLSPRRIIGFASNQAFVFFLLYMGSDRSLVLGSASFERIDLLCTFAFVVMGFVFVRHVSPVVRNRLFARPLLYAYAVLMAAGSLLPLVPGLGDAQAAVTVAMAAGQGLLVGVPFAFLLTAWGRTFGRVPTAVSVPEVFTGSLVAALVCLVFSFAQSSELALLVLRLLPLASVVNIEVPRADEAQRVDAGESAGSEARALSRKILAGTVLFGMAAGFLEALSAQPGLQAMPSYPMAMVLFGAFLLGALSLQLSDAFSRGALNKSYRLAVFVMMLGLLIVPWPALRVSVMPGESVVLAGYLGLETVLISLFLVLARIAALDTAVAFSLGFSALFAGEWVGLLVSDVLAIALPADADPYATVFLAGASALLSYIFLFTERDFDALSQIVTVTDAFEALCARVAGEYGLSAREAEILAYALRGRTSERIAHELVISKSTVDTHLRRIYAKAGVHSRQQLLDLAEVLRESLD